MIRFVEILNAQMDAHTRKKVVFHFDHGKKRLTTAAGPGNAAFLLGACMILRHGDAASSVADSFR